MSYLNLILCLTCLTLFFHRFFFLQFIYPMYLINTPENTLRELLTQPKDF